MIDFSTALQLPAFNGRCALAWLLPIGRVLYHLSLVLKRSPRDNYLHPFHSLFLSRSGSLIWLFGSHLQVLP